jgi:hypothetical protein
MAFGLLIGSGRALYRNVFSPDAKDYREREWLRFARKHLTEGYKLSSEKLFETLAEPNMQSWLGDDVVHKLSSLGIPDNRGKRRKITPADLEMSISDWSTLSSEGRQEWTKLFLQREFPTLVEVLSVNYPKYQPTVFVALSDRISEEVESRRSEGKAELPVCDAARVAVLSFAKWIRTVTDKMD